MNKLLIISTTSGSIINFRLGLIKEALQEGFFVEVACSEVDLKHESELRELGVDVIHYSLSRGGMNPFADFRTILELRRLIRNSKPSSVLACFVKPVVYGGLASIGIKGLTKVSLIEGLGYAFTATPDRSLNLRKTCARYAQLFLYFLSLRFYERIVVLNNDDRIELERVSKRYVNLIEVVLGIGADVSKYRIKRTVSKYPKTRFLFVGRLLKEKGVRELMSAWKIVSSKTNKAELHIIGDLDNSNPSSLSECEIRDFSNRTGVVWHGYSDNVIEFYSASDVFVLPSYREGMPRSGQEAMLAGLAVIITNVPGCRELLGPYGGGIMVEPFDYKQLADAMLFYCGDKEIAHKHGIINQKYAGEHYDEKRISEELLEFLVSK